MAQETGKHALHRGGPGLIPGTVLPCHSPTITSGTAQCSGAKVKTKIKSVDYILFHATHVKLPPFGPCDAHIIQCWSVRLGEILSLWIGTEAATSSHMYEEFNVWWTCSHLRGMLIAHWEEHSGSKSLDPWCVRCIRFRELGLFTLQGDRLLHFCRGHPPAVLSSGLCNQRSPWQGVEGCRQGD